MGWADNYIEKLKNGETVTFRPRGNSMMPFIKSGDLVTVEPVIDENYPHFNEGDIVLCTVSGNQYLHLIGEVKWLGNEAKYDHKYKIENASGFVNGWIKRDKIYGRVILIKL